MNKLTKTYTLLKLMLLIAVLLFVTFQSNAQSIKATDSGYAPVNGIKMYYEVYGEGQPVILLHGAFYTIGLNWSELIPKLAKTRKVIAVELQGHGHTPYSDRQPSLKLWANDIEKLMDYLKMDSADIAGYSMGGSVAYQFAVQSPARLKKLIIISSTYKKDGWQPLISNAFNNFKPELFDNTPLQTAYYAVAPDTTKWRAFLKQIFDFDKQPFDIGDSNIAKIKAPVLIISGDNDGLNKVELMKTYQLLGGGVAADLQPMPKSQLAIVPAQSHVSLMMQTTTIFNLMNNFLQ